MARIFSQAGRFVIEAQDSDEEKALALFAHRCLSVQVAESPLQAGGVVAGCGYPLTAVGSAALRGQS